MSSPPENSSPIASGEAPVQVLGKSDPDNIAKEKEILTVDNDKDGNTAFQAAGNIETQSEENIASINGANTNPEISHFGPWMLVRRPPRMKKQGTFPKKEHNAVSYSGSRFMALNESAEEVVENKSTSIENSDMGHINNSKVEQNGPSNKKVVKVKSPMAGKNPQHKPKTPSKGPIGNSKIQISVVPKPKPSINAHSPPEVQTTESTKQKNIKETEILHRMRILQKKGHAGLENFVTHVTLPDAEMVEYAQLNRGMHTVINPKSIPPDINSSPKGPKGMEVDDFAPSSSIRVLPKNDLHSENLDLKGRISNMCQ
ncbi:hypothetical protein RIF29_17000 [Crotalaria pallida]|uniref:Uncharacterized protein n=1 Tax=Crotalaria pallida TaxID=3830 RepID=A0AAN9IEY3_CROPI